MKVNRNYYPKERDTELKKGDVVVATINGILNYNDYPANSPLDETITYVKSKSVDLPFNDLAIITPEAENSTNIYAQKMDFNTGKYTNLMMMSSPYTYNSMLLAGDSGSDPTFTNTFGIPSYNGSSIFEWGYNIDTSNTTTFLRNAYVYTGFDYRMFLLTPYIEAYKTPLGIKDTTVTDNQFGGYYSEWDSTIYPYVTAVYLLPVKSKYSPPGTYSFLSFPQFSFKNYDFSTERNSYNENYSKLDNTSLTISSLLIPSRVEGLPAIPLFGGCSKRTLKPTVKFKKNPQYSYCYPFFFVNSDYITNVTYGNETTPEGGTYILSSNKITKEVIEKWTNAFGLYWAEDKKTAETADLGKDCTNPKIHLPVIDENGVATGKSETGKNTTKLPQSGWTNPNDVFNKNNVRPDDDNDYTTKQDLNKPSVSPIGSFTRTYAISGENVKLLSDKIWSGDDTAFKTFIDGLALMGENPINSIIDIRFYPFEIPNLGNTNKIVLGRNNTGIVGYPLASVDNNIITFGTAKILEKYNCFLDYPPYTKAELIIPNVGSVELDLTKVMGKNIKLQVIVDYVTGACTAVVFADNTIIHTLAGTIAIEVPITGTNSAQYASSVTNSLLSLPSSIGSAATGISSGNAAQAVSGITGTIGAVGNIISTPLPISSKNSATPMCSLFLPQYAYIRVTRPTFEEPDTYKSTFGYACNLSKRLGDMSGYVVCQNPIIENISATSDEINMIVQYLESGVII